MDSDGNGEDAHEHHQAIGVALAQTAEVPSDQETSEQQEKSIDRMGDDRRIREDRDIHLIY